MVRIVEVSPRDGLQNECVAIPTSVKLKLIQDLAGAGIQEIEATSFVSPKWVPQLADADEVWKNLPTGPRYSALVPNIRGLKRAQDLGVDRIALFTAASSTFTQRNINRTVNESLEEFQQIIESSPKGTWFRGYVSTAFECPFEGRIAPKAVLMVVEKLLEIGIDEIAIGDTIGVAGPIEVKELTQELLKICPTERLAYHFHDTRGTAIANVASAMELGITIFDASAGGLGGCPYAPGAGGNLATEDLVYFLERSGIQTGIDPERLAKATLPIFELIGRSLGPGPAKSQMASLSKLKTVKSS